MAGSYCGDLELRQWGSWLLFFPSLDLVPILEVLGKVQFSILRQKPEDRDSRWLSTTDGCILTQGQCLGAFSKCVGYLMIVTMTWERVAKGSGSGFCKKLFILYWVN